MRTLRRPRVCRSARAGTAGSSGTRDGRSHQVKDKLAAAVLQQPDSFRLREEAEDVGDVRYFGRAAADVATGLRLFGDEVAQQEDSFAVLQR